MIDSAAVWRFSRYALLGLATNLGGYSAYLLVTWGGVEPKLALTVLYVLGATISYIGNRQWTFRHAGSVWSSGLKYLSVHVGGYVINCFMFLVFSERIGLPHQLIQAVAIVVVAMYLYISLNLFVFRVSSAEASKQ